MLGLGILLVRRHVPESPRWLFIHGREEEAERIVGQIEEEVREETGAGARRARATTITVRQRDAIPFREIARRRLEALPAPRDPRPRAVRRPGVPLQRRHLRPRDAPQRVLRRRLGQRSRTSSPSSPLGNFLGPLHPRAAVRHRRPHTDDRRHLPRLGRPGRGARRPAADGSLTTWSFMALVVADVLPRLGRRELRLPDGQRGLPDGDARARDRASSTRSAPRPAASPGRLLFGQLIHSGDAEPGRASASSSAPP